MSGYLKSSRGCICLSVAVGVALCCFLGLPAQFFDTIVRDDLARRLLAVTHGPYSISDGAPPQQRLQDVAAADNQSVAYSLEATFAKCPPLNLVPSATSVRNLRPVDLKVVAAIGDSITAAFAARGYLPLEFRGLSFPIGGDHGRVTLPNILGQYSAKGKALVGAATGFTDPLEDASHILNPAPWKPVNPKHAHLNAAISNARADTGPTQVAWLAKVMAQYEKEGMMSVQNDWKLLTVTLGANDVRAQCRGTTPNDKIIPAWKASVNSTLALIKQHFPRTFVALVAVPNVGDMGKWGHTTRVCAFVQDHVEKGHCPQGGESDSVQQGMNEALQELQAYWSDTVRADDFAVVYQPFVGGMQVPDVSYLSSLDCFHPGQKGHAEMAVALWNSLVTPRKDKKTTLGIGSAPICADKTTILHVD